MLQVLCAVLIRVLIYPSSDPTVDTAICKRVAYYSSSQFVKNVLSKRNKREETEERENIWRTFVFWFQTYLFYCHGISSVSPISKPKQRKIKIKLHQKYQLCLYVICKKRTKERLLSRVILFLLRYTCLYFLFSFLFICFTFEGVGKIWTVINCYFWTWKQLWTSLTPTE